MCCDSRYTHIYIYVVFQEYCARLYRRWVVQHIHYLSTTRERNDEGIAVGRRREGDVCLGQAGRNKLHKGKKQGDRRRLRSGKPFSWLQGEGERRWYQRGGTANTKGMAENWEEWHRYIGIAETERSEVEREVYGGTDLLNGFIS